jgi:prepilin-type processing-associated H-X9-DG protein
MPNETMPNETNVPESSPPATPPRRGCRGCAWVAAVVFFILFLIALLLPAVNAPREAARRMQCQNNLKNIMVAMNSYSAKYGCYPSAYTVDKQGRRIHSWRVLLLEFLDHDLYTQYDFSRPWDSPDNLAVADGMKQNGPYQCPSEQAHCSLNTSYVMLVGPQAFSDGPTCRNPDKITDGLATTIAIVEMSPSGICWAAPYDLNVSEMSFKINDPGHAGVRSCHGGGAYVLFADGHSSLSNDFVTEKTLKALITINGKEDMSKAYGY